MADALIILGRETGCEGWGEEEFAFGVGALVEHALTYDHAGRYAWRAEVRP